jgi:hypothetical protein
VQDALATVVELYKDLGKPLPNTILGNPQRIMFEYPVTWVPPDHPLYTTRLMIDAHLIGFTWRQGRAQNRPPCLDESSQEARHSARMQTGALLRAYARTPALGKSLSISMPRPTVTPIPSWISARQKWHSWR